MSQVDLHMKERLDRIFAGMSLFEREIVVKSLGLLNEAVTKAGAVASRQEGTIARCK
ncbi:MAG: hypothetical protein ACYDHC_08055 [Desulfuromonadaceae bacterium]